jgi:hypothetical protein
MHDVVVVLDALDIPFEDHGHEALALCPGHKERTGKADNSPSWWINLETGMHLCFSCGFKGNLLQLICSVKGFYTNAFGKEIGFDYRAAEAWLATVDEVSIEDLQERLRSLPAYVAPLAKPLEMSEARLAVFVHPPVEVLESRSISIEASSKYNLMWDEKRKNWILPLRDPHFKKLLGWQEKGTVERTFMNRPAGLAKSKTLFGIENQNENVVVVVESPLDCARLASAGVEGAVAVCGSSISEDQVKLLRFSGKIIAAFDNDKAGEKASRELLNWGRKYGLNLFFFNYGSSGAKDPGDLTNEEIAWGIANAKSSLLGESAYVQGNAQTVSG